MVIFFLKIFKPKLASARGEQRYPSSQNDQPNQQPNISPYQIPQSIPQSSLQSPINSFPLLEHSTSSYPGFGESLASSSQQSSSTENLQQNVQFMQNYNPMVLFRYLFQQIICLLARKSADKSESIRKCFQRCEQTDSYNLQSNSLVSKWK